MEGYSGHSAEISNLEQETPNDEGLGDYSAHALAHHLPSFSRWLAGG
jgi:hypothetical protein